MEASPHRVLLVGLPRSGTTWTTATLKRTEGVVDIQEPDNHAHTPCAMRAKRGLGTFPYLEAGDEAPAYERLWQLAFEGAPRPEGPRMDLAMRLIGGQPMPFRDAYVTDGWRAPLRVRLAG